MRWSAGRFRVGKQLLAYDTFNRANGAITAAPSTSGHTWTVSATGAFTISGNMAVPSSTPSIYARLGVTLPRNHMVTVLVPTLPASGGVGIVGRLDPATNSGYLLSADPAGAWRLLKSNGGTGNTLITSYTGLTAGDTIGMVFQGSTIYTIRNGVVVGSTTDTTYNGSGVALRTGVNGTNRSLDDLKVWSV